MLAHFLRLPALCIVLSGLFCCPGMAADLATAILQGDGVAPSWDAAPSEITVPKEWMENFLALGKDTVKKKTEFASCLTYGQAGRDMEGETALLKQISALAEKRMTAFNAKDTALAQKLADEMAGITKTLEKKLEVDPSKGFGATATTAGITLAVDSPPTCIGSYIGNMHTHPDHKRQGKVYYNPTPSDMDTAFTMVRFALYGSKQSFVVSHKHATLMIPTQDFLNRFDFTVPNASGKDNLAVAGRAIKQMTFLLESDRQDDLLPALLKSYGIVYYEGDLPVLHKVGIPKKPTAGFVQYINDTFKPRRSVIDNALAQAKLIIKNNKHIDTPTDLDEGADEVRTMNDTDYMHALGLPTEERDIRLIANNTKDYSDVGACVLYEAQTAFVYAPRCKNNASYDLIPLACDKQTSPIIEWQHKDAEHSIITFIYPDAKNKDKCLLKIYNLGADGKAGDFVEEESREISGIRLFLESKI